MADETNQETTVVEKDKSGNNGVVVAIVAVIAIVILVFVALNVFGDSGGTDVNVTPPNPVTETQ